jgi:2-polyprenyl-6-methoxyphenol hydroxylase-like FAD-dependent oxidoreductase
MNSSTLQTTCCVAGGGPAGIMAGFLLARAGVRTVVLERHRDFFRDFRGDTIHPSTLQIMHELGLLDEFLKLPHEKVRSLRVLVGDTEIQVADFGHLPSVCRYIALMPQWDFLNFLAAHAARYPSFTLLMRTEAHDLIEEGGRIRGLRAKTTEGDLEVRADLVVAADGRHSDLRRAAGLSVEELGAPIDVLWFRMSRRATDPQETMGRFLAGAVFVMIQRGDYWQCGLVIAKGGFDRVQAAGLDAFRTRVRELAPFLGDRVNELADWEQVKLLTVRVDRLRHWYRPGLLCIGDAAHAMSPVGGVGINLAIQDAVAAANLLAAKLRDGDVTERDLEAVQRRRYFPTRVTQALQLAVQNRVIAPTLGATTNPTPPLVVRLFAQFAPLRRIPARIVGLGVRPEHITSPAWTPAAAGQS